MAGTWKSVTLTNMQKEQQYLADMEQRKRFLIEEVENLELHKKKLTSDVNHLKEEETEEQAKHNTLRIKLAEETQLMLVDRSLDIAGIEERLNNREGGIQKRENEIKKRENELTEREANLTDKELKFENDKKVSDGYFA